MALRDQPYLPLYVQDFLTDEKLAECSAESTGVYIRTMCLMHKSEQYGKILLKQKHKQTDNQIKNFALMLAKHLPYTTDIIESSIAELVEERVLHIEGDFLIQKRMVNDNELSIKRSLSGKKGGEKSLGKDSDFAQAKLQANTENENENINTNNNTIEGVQGEIFDPPADPPKVDVVKLDPDELLISKIQIEESFKAAFLKWLKYKRKNRQSYKCEDSTQLAYAKLYKLAGGNAETAMALVENAMSNNYAGIFPINNNQKQSKNGTRHGEVSFKVGGMEGSSTL